MDKGLGLYIHIPFCVKKCNYCDFLSFGGVDETVKEQYLDALAEELAWLSVNFDDRPLSSGNLKIPDDRPHISLDTVYFGGGTPSVLAEDQFETIMIAINKNFAIKEDAEITVEINPGTVTKEKLKTYKRLGVNRISMGLQSDDDQQLAHMGRVHDFRSFEETYRLLRQTGFDNISIDIIFGLSNQTMNQWKGTVTKIIDLAPEHISAYSLIIEPDTCYEKLYENDQLNLPSEALEREMFWYCHDRLEEAGYIHYEISNYAKPGKKSRHNSSYWDLTSYIGAGLGASSFYNNTRYKNISNLATYIEAKGNLDIIRQVEQVNTPAMNLEEAFFLGLRCMNGVNLQKLATEYGKEALEAYKSTIDKLINQSLLIKEGNSIRLTKRGIDISNQVMAEFIL